MSKAQIDTINIRPGVTILSVLRHLNYKPWFALAEFVDNSVQSYLNNRDRIHAEEGRDFKLRVAIEYDDSSGGRLVIRDNAAGIAQRDYARAFRPAEIPPDRSGLSEFGIGMKSAACWFAPKWSVRTCALGESVERAVHFDISRIVHDNLDELSVETKRSRAQDHFTEVTLAALHQPPQSKTIAKIKQYLSDIYRVFIREGQLELSFNDEILTYESPAILSAPFFRRKDEEAVEWKKEISFDFGQGLSVHGFAAIRERANVSRAGFALFRRRRLIEGGGEEGWRPEEIFGKSNSYRYQRVFGELHLEGFDVSHTKDGFRWDENEQAFLGLLKEHLDADPLPLLEQAEGLRVRSKPSDVRAGAVMAVARTAAVIEGAVAKAIPILVGRPQQPAEPPAHLTRAKLVAHKRIRKVPYRGREWTVTIEISSDPGVTDWLTVTEHVDADKGEIGLRLSMDHPFMHRFSGSSAEEIEPLLRVAIAVGLGEMVARGTAGVKRAGEVRRNMNDLLREALSEP
ncbi:MAG: ATP-binding protein [Tepidisphaeraceae bacterium]